MTEDDPEKVPPFPKGTVSKTGGLMRQGKSGRTHKEEMDSLRRIEKESRPPSPKTQIEKKKIPSPKTDEKKTPPDSKHEIAFRTYALKQSLGQEEKIIDPIPLKPGEVRGKRDVKDRGKVVSPPPGTKKKGSQVSS